MKLIFLGSGSAFTVGNDNFQSNMIIKSDSGKHLLIDCGTDIRFAMYCQSYDHGDIDAVFVSHLHADHVGGLEWLAFTTLFDEKCKKPTLFLVDAIGNSLWNTVLSGGLTSLEGQTAKLSTYFSVKKAKTQFQWENIRFHLIPTLHVIGKNKVLPSFGLFFNGNKHKVVITNDTQFTPDILNRYYEEADLIFHDCETSKTRTGVHAHYDDLRKLPAEVKKKMWLYHYNPGKLPNAIKDGFKGFVKRGQEFIL